MNRLSRGRAAWPSRPRAFAAAHVFALALATCGLATESARAEAARNADSQFNFLLGSVSGSYAAGQVTGEVAVSTGIRVTYESFTASRNSWFFHATLGEDAGTARMSYLAFGVGKRYYFGSLGMVLDGAEGATRITIRPKLRFFYGYEAGFAEVAFVQYEVLELSSTMIEFGGNVGAIYQFGQSIGLAAEFSVDYGYGFTSTAVTGTAKKMLIGVAYSF